MFKNPYGPSPVTPNFTKNNGKNNFQQAFFKKSKGSKDSKKSKDSVSSKPKEIDGFSLVVSKLQKDIELSRISENALEKS